jgi:hypothetical protein
LPRKARLAVNITHQSCALISSYGCVINWEAGSSFPLRRCGLDIKSIGNEDTESQMTFTEPNTAATCNAVFSLTGPPATALPP